MLSFVPGCVPDSSGCVMGSVWYPDSKRMRHGECLVVSLTEVGASWGVSGRVPDNREIRMDRGEHGLEVQGTSSSPSLPY